MFRTILASLLALIFTLLILPITFLWGVYSTFFNENFYKGDFVDVTYDFIVEKGPSFLEIEKIQEFAALSEEDLGTLFKKIFSKEDIADFFDSSVDSFVTALSSVRNQNVRIIISLDLLSKKRDLISTEIASLLFERLPKCDKSAKVVEGDFKCIPEKLARPDFISNVKGTMDREVFARLPNELAFDLGVPNGIEGDGLSFFKQTFSWLFIAALLFLLLDLFLLGMVIMEPWYKVLRWEAKTVLAPSIIMLLFLILLNNSSGIFEKIYLSSTVNPDEQGLNLIKVVIDLFLGSLANTLFVYVVPVFVISLGLWIASIVYGRRASSDKYKDIY